jgi:murein DD-endopeptidase MepM/ murein hydrolase activator NlpD
MLALQSLRHACDLVPRTLVMVVAAALSTGCAPQHMLRGQAATLPLSAPTTQSYTLQPGETLWRVARRHGMSADELARKNGIADPTKIRAGTVLTVPAPQGAETAAKPAPSPELTAALARAGSATAKTAAAGKKPADGAKVADAARPADGGKAADAVKPADAARHADAGKAADAAKPADAARRADAGKAADAAKPADTADHADHDDHADPPKPADAAEPSSGGGSLATPPPPGPRPTEPVAHDSGLATPPPPAGAHPATPPTASTPRSDDDEPATPTSYPFRWPLEGQVVGRFGAREGATHDGIDITSNTGTPVRAAALGRVIFAGRQGSYGNLVIVRHDGGLLTVYAHLSVTLVRRGQVVAAGDAVGRLGGTATAPAPLHFEVREGVVARNPLKFLPP